MDPASGEARNAAGITLIFVRDGQIVGRVQTRDDGVARIGKLPPGTYSVVALGPEGMAAFGTEVLPAAAGASTVEYLFDALLVPPRDMETAQRALRSVVGPSRSAAGPAAVTIPVTTQAAAGKVWSVPVAARHEAADIEQVAAGADDSEPAALLRGEPVLVRDGEAEVGHLLVPGAPGTLPAPLRNARLVFLRGGELLGTVETDADGYCGIGGLEDGSYSMVGIGQDGFVALGVRVESDPAVVTTEESAVTGEPVAFHGNRPCRRVGKACSGCRVPCAKADACQFAPGFACGGCGQLMCGGCQGPPPFGPPPFGGPGFGPFGGGGGFAGGGGFGGGFGGGGGGFGGGGLLGPLLGAGLGAALGAGLGDDDEDGGAGGGDDFAPPAPVSPSLPPQP